MAFHVLRKRCGDGYWTIIFRRPHMRLLQRILTKRSSNLSYHGRSRFVLVDAGGGAVAQLGRDGNQVKSRPLRQGRQRALWAAVIR